MSNKSSAGSFCSLVVATATGTSNSITSLDVSARGNGAEAYCIANASVYRYNATSTQTTLGDTFLVPLSGGGCWFKQGAQSDYTQQVTGTDGVFNGATLSPTPNDSVWAAFPAAAGAYAVGFSQTLWSVNTTTGIMTYHGPSGLKFLAAMTVSVAINSATFAQFVIGEVSLSANGSLIGGTTSDPSAVRGTFLGTDATSGLLPSEFTQNFIINPDPGDTIQYAIRHIFPSTGAFDAFTFYRYRAVIVQA